MTAKRPTASAQPTFREIEHTADLGIEVTAADLFSLLATAGQALYSLIADPSSIEIAEEVKVATSADTTEELLHAWLCELLALFNVQGIVGKRCVVTKITNGRVEGLVQGDKLDLNRHAFRTEIKGVTYHNFKVWQKDGLWYARVIFDV